MALVAIDFRLLFQLPFIVIEYRRTYGPGSICGSTEEPFGDIMMLSGVGAAFGRRLGIVAVAMKLTPADCALFTGFYIHTASDIIPVTKFRVSYAVTIHISIIRSLYGNGQGFSCCSLPGVSPHRVLNDLPFDRATHGCPGTAQNILQVTIQHADFPDLYGNGQRGYCYSLTRVAKWALSASRPSHRSSRVTQPLSKICGGSR